MNENRSLYARVLNRRMHVVLILQELLRKVYCLGSLAVCLFTYIYCDVVH